MSATIAFGKSFANAVSYTSICLVNRPNACLAKKPLRRGAVRNLTKRCVDASKKRLNTPTKIGALRVFGRCPGMSGLACKVTKMNPEAEYLAPRQLAHLIGVSESSLAKARMRGDGPQFVKIGRSVRYSRDAGLAWMAAHTRRSTSETADHKVPRSRRIGTT